MEVVDHVANGKPPPQELEWGNNWLSFHTPYYAGGQVDQPAGMMRKMRTALNLSRALKGYYQSLHVGQSQKWINDNSELWGTVSWALVMYEKQSENKSKTMSE